ncbi:hypothetical protein K438DRAFT_1541387, partial [Mycena galopus ATCC 62051]
PPFGPGGGGGGVGGPPGGGGPPFAPPGGSFDWQINRKLTLSLIPEWDGHGKMAIAYICKVAKLLRLLPQMSIDLGATAPLKFTGRASTWWMTQTPTVRSYLSQDWGLLLQAIQAHFLNANWLQERRREWEEMRFRQRGHEGEMPLDFLQRRLVYHSFLYTEEEDGIRVVDRILATSPDVWDGLINSRSCPDVFSLMSTVRRFNASLMSTWNTANHTGGLNGYYPRRMDRNARAADREDRDEEESERSEKDAFVANNSRDRSHPSASSSSRPPWPEGKTVRGYEFVRRDDVHSDRALAHGACYICTSPKHFARDCPHYGHWLSLCDANLLEVEVSREAEEADYNEFVAMIVELQSETSSAYSSAHETVSPTMLREVHVVGALETGALAAHLPVRNSPPNHNERRRRAAE